MNQKAKSQRSTSNGRMPIVLPKFRGYTVDNRLREFRKIEYGQMPQFIPFDSAKGQCLLKAYQRHII